MINYLPTVEPDVLPIRTMNLRWLPFAHNIRCSCISCQVPYLTNVLVSMRIYSLSLLSRL